MTEYKIEGLKCESCVKKVTDAATRAGYNDVQVTLNPPLLRFSSGPDPSLQALQRVVSSAGDYKLASLLEEHSTAPSSDERLTPLLIVVGYITAGTLLRAYISGDTSVETLMSNFMGGFLVVFSLFKLLNLKGFAEAYATYDIVAAKSRAYALAYPFIELTLGVFYLVGAYPLLTNIATLAIMAIGSVGVFKALRTKRKFQCACLGTALKLPMTKVTLVEDIGMGLMALAMISHQIG